MGTLKQDFRYGLRMLRKHPGYTAVAIITLALAIGANTAIFSAVYPVLLRPLPFRDADRLVTIGEGRHQVGCCSYLASYPDFLDWQRSAKGFQSLAGYAPDAFTITGNGDPKTMFCAMVTTNFFSTLGVSPVLGRDFAAGEDLPEGSGPTVAMLSYSFWHSDFSGDPKIIGRVLRLDGKPVTVIGILPRAFELGPAGLAPIWVPLHLNLYETTARNGRWLNVIARLAPGVTLDQARAEMQTINAQLAREYPQQNSAVTVNVELLRSEIVGNIRPAGPADRLRQRRELTDEPLHRSPPRIRYPRRLGSDAISPGAAITDRESTALCHRGADRISGGRAGRVASCAIHSRGAAYGHALPGGCRNQFSRVGLRSRNSGAHGRSFRIGPGTVRSANAHHRRSEG
jgi:hypothetical protein